MNIDLEKEKKKVPQTKNKVFITPFLLKKSHNRLKKENFHGWFILEPEMVMGTKEYI